MSFYSSESSRFIELSAPVSRELQLMLLTYIGTTLGKPHGAGGCYLVGCKNYVTRAMIVYYLQGFCNRVRSETHLDKTTKCWSPVRYCDVRKI